MVAQTDREINQGKACLTRMEGLCYRSFDEWCEGFSRPVAKGGIMGRMVKWALGLVIILCLGAFQAAAQETSLGGDWWVGLAGGDRGGGALTLGVPAAGVFEVSGNLLTLGSGEPFKIADGQALRLDFKGKITGNLLLQDLLDNDIGELEVTGGGTDKRFTKLRVNGNMTLYGSPPVSVRIRGERMPESAPVLTGRTIMEGRVSGPGIRSRTLDLSVAEEDELEFPFFVITGGGSVLVDGMDQDVTLMGIFVRTPSRASFPKTNIFGWGEASDAAMGAGPLVGNLRKPATDIPELSCKVRGNRNFRLWARLDEPVSPIIAVTPDSIDFGTVNVGDSLQRAFTVTNIGAGTLDGDATADGDGFSVVGGSPYSLSAGQSAIVTIEFTPPAAGVFNGTVSFTGGGGTTRSVTGTGE
jgi:hypothetical protein